MTDTATPDNPPSDRDREDLRAWLREHRRAERHRRLSQGRGRPRTHAEIRTFLDGLGRRFNLDRSPDDDPPAA